MSRDQIIRRFWSKVDKDGPGGCWTFANLRTDGYGRFHCPGLERYYVSAHRFSYELLVGPIPDGYVLDHLCRNPSCVNPSHLEAVTFAENVLRGESFSAQNKRKTHCKQGHPYEGENLTRSKQGHRKCRICARAYYKKWYEKSKAAA